MARHSHGAIALRPARVRSSRVVFEKKELSEADIRSKYILPAILKVGWDLHQQIREELPINAGAVIVRGRKVERDTILKADYVLFWKGEHPLAVVEAKDNNHPIGAGMEQALTYAKHLDAPFAFSSNGDGFVLHDRTGQEAPRRAGVP